MSENGQVSRVEWIDAALEEHEGPLLRYALRFTQDAERARDVVQDTFLKLCREDQASLNGKLAQWLYTVCRNRALDVYRKESRMTVIADERLPTRISDDPRPDEAVETQDSVGQMLLALGDLPPNQQECIRLKFQSGLSYREIAEVTGLSVSNVGVQIHTGLKKLRQLLN